MWTAWSGQFGGLLLLSGGGPVDEKLDKEQQEAYAARVRYDAAARELASIDADLARLEARLKGLSGCEQRYQDALMERFREIKETNSPAAQELMESESRVVEAKAPPAGNPGGSPGGEYGPQSRLGRCWNPWTAPGAEHHGSGRRRHLVRPGQVRPSGRGPGTGRAAAGRSAAVQNRAGRC